MNDTVEVDVSEPGLTALALTLVNNAVRPPERLITLMRQLKPSGLAIDDLTPEAAPALPGLVAAGLMLDDAAAYKFLTGQPWALRRELINASRAFPGYAVDLPLDEDEVQALATENTIPDPVKAKLMDELPLFADRLDAASATSLAQWAQSRARNAPLESVASLAQRGAAPAAILAVLALRSTTLSWDDIVPVLLALGEPYSGLTVAGDNHRLDLPASDGLRTLIHRLRDLGRVTSYRELENGGVLGVRRKVTPLS